MKTPLQQLKQYLLFRPSIDEIENISNTKNTFSKYKISTSIVFRETLYQMRTHDLGTMSGALTYSVILALIPLLAIAFFFFQTIGGLDKFINQTLIPLINANFSEIAGSQIKIYLDTFVAHFKPGFLGSIAFITFFITIIGLLTAIENQFDNIFLARSKRPLWRRILNYWTLISLTPFIFTFSTSQATHILHAYPELEKILFSVSFLAIPLSIAIQSLGFTSLFLILPNRNLPVKALLAGGFIAGILFQALEKFNGFLTRNILQDSTAIQLYGTAPIIAVAFFFWIKLVWLLILASACLVMAITNIIEVISPHIAERSPDDGLLHCTQIFTLICKDYTLSGEGIIESQVLQELQLPVPVITHWLLWLEKRRVVFTALVNGKKRYFLSNLGNKLQNNPGAFLTYVLLPQFKEAALPSANDFVSKVAAILEAKQPAPPIEQANN